MKHDLSLYMGKCMIIGKEKTNIFDLWILRIYCIIGGEACF